MPQAKSPHERCALACQARGVAAVQAAFTAGLILTKWDQNLHMLPDPNAVSFPCGVFWFNDAETEKSFSTARDLIGYPVHWAVLDRKIDGTYKIPSELLFLRHLTVKALINQQLDSVLVPETDLVEWRPDKVIDEKMPAYQYLVSAMTFVCWCKLTRGLY